LGSILPDTQRCHRPKHSNHAEAEKWLDYYDSDVFDALSMKYALGRIANQRMSPMSHTVKLWS